MKTFLKQQLGQRLSLTPQLLQSIRLLQLNTMELEREVNRALEENPFLENNDAGDEVIDPVPEIVTNSSMMEDEFSLDSTPSEDNEETEAFLIDQAFCMSENSPDETLASREAPTTTDVRQHVLQQLTLELGNSRDLAIAAWLLDHVDDNGYLELPIEQLASKAQDDFGIDPIHFENLHRCILRCEPAGFASRDLRECLLAQLAQLTALTPGHRTAISIVMHHLETLGQHDHESLARQLKVGIDEIKLAEKLILTLDPRPGRRFDTDPVPVSIIPDVLVVSDAKGWRVALYQHASARVRLNPVYEQSLKPVDLSPPMRHLLQEARWLTQGLRMRYDTLLRTASAIFERQIDFLKNGDEGMRPLILREIAEAVGMHESSISRITSGKYVQTPHGIFELKHFFGTRIEGAEVTGVAVQAMVKRLIETENPEIPLADDIIAKLLARQGVCIARRTVAKYREVMKIASAKKRRRSLHSSQRRMALVG